MTRVLRAALLCAGVLCSSCGSGASLPSALQGRWADTCCGGCKRSFTFTSDSVIFAQSCPYTGSDGWEASVVEVFSAEEQFRTSDDTYFAYHVVGTTLHLNKTNPGSSRPTLAPGWWSSSEYTLAK